MQVKKYFRCPSCKNLEVVRKNRGFEFICKIYGVSLEKLLENYENYDHCIYFIGKNFDGGDVLQPNIVWIGRKELSRYILATLKALETSNRALVKARGKLISKAVDVAELVKNRYLPGTRVERVKIGSVLRDNNKWVSEIEITLVWRS